MVWVFLGTVTYSKNIMVSQCYSSIKQAEVALGCFGGSPEGRRGLWNFNRTRIQKGWELDGVKKKKRVDRWWTCLGKCVFEKVNREVNVRSYTGTNPETLLPCLVLTYIHYIAFSNGIQWLFDFFLATLKSLISLYQSLSHPSLWPGVLVYSVSQGTLNPFLSLMSWAQSYKWSPVLHSVPSLPCHGGFPYKSLMLPRLWITAGTVQVIRLTNATHPVHSHPTRVNDSCCDICYVYPGYTSWWSKTRHTTLPLSVEGLGGLKRWERRLVWSSAWKRSTKLFHKIADIGLLEEGKTKIMRPALGHAIDCYLLAFVLWKDTTSGPKSTKTVNLFLSLVWSFNSKWVSYRNIMSDFRCSRWLNILVLFRGSLSPLTFHLMNHMLPLATLRLPIVTLFLKSRYNLHLFSVWCSEEPV